MLFMGWEIYVYCNTKENSKQSISLGPSHFLNKWLETHEGEEYIYNYLSLEPYSILHKHIVFKEKKLICNEFFQNTTL